MSPDPAATLWSAALGRLQLQTPKPTFDTWLAGTTGCSLEGDEIVVALPSAFAADWIEQHLQTLVESAASAIAGRPLRVQYVIGDAGQAHAAPTRDESEAAGTELAVPSTGGIGGPLWPEHTFDNFVVGESNRLAYAAAQAVAREQGPAYNPLYFYGPVGLGKTHLMHAIGQKASADGRSALYITTEGFTNAYLSALRSKRMEEFRDHFRAVDVLLVDDIQFLAGRPSTQHAFFDTFNAVLTSGGQLVLSSDRPAGELKQLEPRLRSRFEGGLQADLSPPDLETRLAMATAFAVRANISIPANGLQLIAERATESARQLYGCITRLAALAEFTQQPVTLHLIREALGPQAAPASDDLTPAAILRAVALSRNLPVIGLSGRGRDREVSSARQLAMHLLHTMLGLSPEEIGAIMGNRDRTTVLYGLRRAEEAINAKAALADEVESIRVSLQNFTEKSALSDSA